MTISRMCLVILAGLVAARAAAQVAVDPGVIQALEAGPARIIVELLPPAGYRPEGGLAAEAVRAQREAIADAQEFLLAAISGDDIRLNRRFETVPFLALQIETSGLTKLRSMPERVVRIFADAAAVPNHAESSHGVIPNEP